MQRQARNPTAWLYLRAALAIVPIVFYPTAMRRDGAAGDAKISRY
jgi:hypothetical protein